MSADDKDLSPDSTILSIVFPDDLSVNVTILAQTWTVCTFRARHKNGDDVVRLELASDSRLSRLHTIAVLQKIAALEIPDLIPDTKRIGQGNMAGGQEVYFSVIAYVQDSVTLDKVWADIDDQQKLEIMKHVQSSMHRLHSLRSDDTRVKTLLTGTEFATHGSNLGGPELGYFTDTISFLQHISHDLDLPNDVLSISNLDGAVVVKAKLQGDYQEVHLSRETLEDLSKYASLCHNDLEPRNCLVRPTQTPNGGSNYTLVAIIDWEMASFLPRTYEIVSKHYNLGSSNLYLPWYTSLVSAARAHTYLSHEKQLASAVDLMYRAADEHSATRSIVWVQFRQKWLAREGLVRNEDPFIGWEPMDHVPIANWKFSQEENDKLEVDVFQELGRI